jgi:multidrug resistance efflux pump
MAVPPTSAPQIQLPGQPPPYAQQPSPLQQPFAQHQQQVPPAPHVMPPRPMEAPADAKPPPPKKSLARELGSKLRGTAAKYSRWIVMLSVGAGVYGAFSLYERRQPYEWSGSVEMHSVSVGSRVGGRVKSVLVREGQRVNRGDVLVVLDSAELDVQRELALADLEGARAVLEKLSNGARPAEVNAAMARVAAARAAAGQAYASASHEATELSRTKALYQGGAVSAFEAEAVKARNKVAAGEVARAAARAKEEEASLKLLMGGTRPEDLRAARAQVAAAEAKVKAIDGQIYELSIRAPNPARVEALAVRPGDLLKADARAATLLEVGQLYVTIYVPEPNLGKIKIGQEVPVSVDSFPSRTFRGRVEHINEVGEFTPRRLVTTEERADEVFGARIALLEGDAELRAGMAAFIHVPK